MIPTNIPDKELLITQLKLVYIGFGDIKYLYHNGYLLLNCAAAMGRALKSSVHHVRLGNSLSAHMEQIRLRPDMISKFR